LLDISNIESGDMELRPAQYSFAEFLSTISAQTRIRIGDKPLEFELVLSGELPANLYGDEQRVKQVVMNLLTNAVKYTKKGKVTLSVSREKASGFSGGSGEPVRMVFAVRDTGIGIKPEDLKKLFTDYGQIDTAASRGADGTGMGLLITKKLAEMMEGGVQAESRPGEGSLFTAKVKQNASGRLGKDVAQRLVSFTYADESSAPEEKPHLPYARVLVVDDVATNLAVANSIMKKYGLAVDTATSGEEAVKRVSGGAAYDAIFMDHMMPGMDGIEATRLIREWEKNQNGASAIPIIAFTANALPGNEEMFKENGFSDYMTKPIKTQVLEKILLQWVKNPEKEKAWVAAGGAEKEKAAEEQRRIAGAMHILADKKVEGVDLEAGAEQFGGEESYLEIVRVFVSNTPKLLESIRNAPQAAAQALDVLQNYRVIVHGIKGSCYGICAQEVGRQAEDLEKAAREGDLQKIVAENDKFVKAAEALVQHLKPLLPQEDDKVKEKKSAPDPAVLKSLHDAAAVYDIDGMTQAVKILDAATYDTGGELVKNLKEAVEGYEYKEVLRLLG
jgi:CheY-like chemotaxis protein/anti-sigma regulatory factor (Ser/Thr protein kinase)